MLEAADGDQASYLDIAETIEEDSPTATKEPARAVAPPGLWDRHSQHRRPPAQPWLPARLHRWTSLSPASTSTRTPRQARCARHVDRRARRRGPPRRRTRGRRAVQTGRQGRRSVRDVAAATASWRTVAVDVSLPDREINRMARGVRARPTCLRPDGVTATEPRLPAGPVTSCTSTATSTFSPRASASVSTSL